MNVSELLLKQKQAFRRGINRSYESRRGHLKALRHGIRKYEAEIAAALFADLHKSAYESYLTETGLVLNEISFALRHLKQWMKPKRVNTANYQCLQLQ